MMALLRLPVWQAAMAAGLGLAGMAAATGPLSPQIKLWRHSAQRRYRSGGLVQVRRRRLLAAGRHTARLLPLHVE